MLRSSQQLHIHKLVLDSSLQTRIHMQVLRSSLPIHNRTPGLHSTKVRCRSKRSFLRRNRAFGPKDQTRCFGYKCQPRVPRSLLTASLEPRLPYSITRIVFRSDLIVEIAKPIRGDSCRCSRWTKLPASTPSDRRTQTGRVRDTQPADFVQSVAPRAGPRETVRRSVSSISIHRPLTRP